MSNNVLNQDFGSDEEDDDFNPAPAVDSDEEGARPGRGRGREVEVDEDAEDDNEGVEGEGKGDEDEEGDEDEVEDEEDEEEDEDEDEDDEDAVSGRPKKRRRRGGVNAFFEEEAGVDDDDEEAEDEEDDMGDGFGAEAHPDDLDALPVGAELDDRRHRQLDRQRELEAHMDAEKQAAALKERYGRNRMVATDSVVVPKRLLLPSVDDPSIWGVRCKPGKERDVVLNIQKRIEQRPPGTRHGLKIISAFERGKTMTGYVYIEARRQAEVMEALDGLLDVYPKTKMVLVPVKEMPDLLRVKKSEELNPGDWVRIKRGKYQGDLAQIEEVETNGLEVTVRLVPRLDYGLNEDLSAPADAAKRKRFGAANNTAARPPQRLFSEAEASKKHGRHLVGTSNLSGKSWNYMGDTYVDGFLVKEMKIQHLITTNVNPRLEEVTMFARGSEDGTANIDLASLANTLKNTVAEDAYRPGDLVEVYKGEQQGIIGKTVATRGDIITLEVTEGDMKGQVIDAPIKTLRKRFREGDHVKVIGGSRYQDELGMVVQIKGDSVTILSDMSMEEITVFSKDLRLSTESGVDGKLGTFDVHDLVQLDATTVACIIQVDRESLRVIDQNGSVRNVLPSRIASKIAKRKDAVATDRNGAEIRHGDTVREMYGEQRSGVIMHIHRSFLFLHNKAQTENTGVIVVRTSNVVTVSAKGGRATGPDLSRMNPAIMQRPPQGGAMPPPRVGRDRLIGKTVGITKGSYKGLIGIVRETTEDLVRVELHTKGTKVMVPRTGVVVKDPVTGQTIDMGRGGRPRVPGGPGGPPQPSWSGSRTPMAALDSRTPAWGGSLSSRTPAWGGSAASGSRTPAWKADGARTAYGGAMGGGRTPAWNSGARTPFDSGSGGGSGGGFDAFAAGSRTPAWGAATGSRTPAWTANSTSASSAAANTGRYDAPTPGGDYSAPTPGAYPTAPTPGASGTASTPRWAESAPTPGALNAPTPGAGGGGLSVGSRLPYDAPTPAMAATPGAMGDDNPTYLDDSE
ncbi:Transcription elongation factor spt5 [Talaromyces pinophilus]|nr:Transcription elongation factor spt5 [Talaromyces pinophilus]